MMQHWNEVQPVDSFQVVMKGTLHRHDHKVVAYLYQPLMGPVCMSLYTTLWHAVTESRLWSDTWNHYHLMNMLGLNLQEIYDARLKLEGIGLLKTYIKEEEDRTFIYELLPPLSAEQFFTDGMLNIYLYQKLGQAHFLRLKKYFSDGQIDRGEYADITRSFQDVFESIGVESLTNPEAHQAGIPEKGQGLHRRAEAVPIPIDGRGFDFALLEDGLSNLTVPRKVLTPAVKDAISKLAFLYSINAIDMQHLLLSVMNASQTVDIEELRKAARDWYQMENGDRLPELIDKRETRPAAREPEKEMTKQEKLVHYLETVSPRELLVDLSDGAEPAKADVKAVEEVMFQQKLEPGVMNVLIHYVMLKTDMKLSKSYLEKIASHWSRKKIKSVREAMDLAIEENRQYQEWASGKTAPTQRKRKPIRTEKLPDWFLANEHVTAKAPAQAEETEELEEKRKRLEAIQRKYKKAGGEKGGEDQ